MDGRTWEARLLARVRRDLTEHVGGSPTVTQRVMIDRAAWVALHLAQIDRRTIEALAVPDAGSHAALAASLSSLLGQLDRGDAVQPARGPAQQRSAALAVPT